jgi:hypothetical protein
MRFVVTGEWHRNRLLQAIVVLYVLYVVLLIVTNGLLYFEKMSLSPASVVAHYLGDADEFTEARSYQGLLELSHFHLFAMGMLLMVLTHLILFIPVGGTFKAWLIIVPFLSGLLSEGAGWLVRYVSADFAILKVLGFLLLQGSLIVLAVVSLWSVMTRQQAENYMGFIDDEE